MNILSAAEWSKVEPLVRAHCPKLTSSDLAECQFRVDLLTAKIQSRHWVSRVEARRTVLALLEQADVLKSSLV